MTRPIPARRPLAPLRTPPAPQRPNHGWGKLVGALLLGMTGALVLQLPGAITGLIAGALLGHWFDSSTASDPFEEAPNPRDARELNLEVAATLGAEVSDAFAALERTAGRTAPRHALSQFLAQQLGLPELPAGKSGAALPWQQDLAGACARLADRLDHAQKRALVVALYRHATALALGPGPARLLLRDGVHALGISADEENGLRNGD